MKIGYHTDCSGKRRSKGGKEDHGIGEEILFNLRLAGKLPEAVQRGDRRVGLRPLSRLFSRPFDQGQGHRCGGSGLPGEMIRSNHDS